MTPRPAAEKFICGYCGCETAGLLYSGRDTRGDQWQWGRCAECRSISLVPRPTPEQLAQAYDSSYYGAKDTKFSGLAARFIKYCKIKKAARLAKLLPRKGVVLDVGCGDGTFLSALGDEGE